MSLTVIIKTIVNNTPDGIWNTILYAMSNKKRLNVNSVLWYRGTNTLKNIKLSNTKTGRPILKSRGRLLTLVCWLHKYLKNILSSNQAIMHKDFQNLHTPKSEAKLWMYHVMQKTCHLKLDETYYVYKNGMKAPGNTLFYQIYKRFSLMLI